MSLNIPLIRSSFEAVKPISNEAMTHFYETLFQNFPAVKPLFAHTDLERQKKSLIHALAYIVDHLDDSDHLVEYLKKLGSSHVKYSIQDEHYPMIGQSLLSTLKFFFKGNWNAELEMEWTHAYQLISDSMRLGASAKLKGASSSEVKDSIQITARNLLIQSIEKQLAGEEFLSLIREKAKKVLLDAI